MRFILHVSKIFLIISIVLISFSVFFLLSFGRNNYCMTGAFLNDSPSAADIQAFKNAYGKKPFLVMIFMDWDKFPSRQVIDAVYGNGCVLLVTWEPQDTLNKKPMDYDGLVSGKYDSYISEFAARLKALPGPVFLRFAHEMNGNWYPWSAVVIGSEKYKAVYTHVKDIFDKSGAVNVKWVFSVNWENVPKENKYQSCYPGDKYVDYIGIDGYNWGNSAVWSKWRSFKEIFSGIYKDISANYKKPVLITEFSSSSSGGNKTKWIKQAFGDMRRMKNIKGFSIFLVNKQAAWGIVPGTNNAVEIKKQLRNPHFIDAIRN